jgi:hypothetical protein
LTALDLLKVCFIRKDWTLPLFEVDVSNGFDMKLATSVSLTVEQINAILMESRIFSIHSISRDGNIIVLCDDDLLRAVTFQGYTLIWLDS